MVKRILSLILLLSLLVSLFCGCGKTDEENPVQPINCYYLRRSMGYGEQDGVIAAQVVDLEDQPLDYMQLMRLYLDGPSDPTLILPVPPDVSVLGVTVENGIATVTLTRNFSQLSGCDLSIAAACMTKTLTQFEEIDTVRLRAQNAQLAGQEYLELEEEYVVLTDGGAVENMQVSIYFADADGRYLLELVELVNDVEEQDLPEYLVHRLIGGPETSDSLAVLPSGTELLDIDVSGSVCTVNFSDAFMTNCPSTWQQERLTILAVVNTLTSLENVDRVKILVDGQALDPYLYLDLSQELMGDESCIGPVRAGLGEFGAVLCVPMQGYDKLFACPMRLQGRSTEESTKIALEALMAYEGINGLYNLLPEDLTINAFVQSGGICMVDLSDDPLQNCTTDEQKQLCLQSMVLTVSQTAPINRMQITVNGVSLQDMHTLDTNWLIPQKEILQQ